MPPIEGVLLTPGMQPLFLALYRSPRHEQLLLGWATHFYLPLSDARSSLIPGGPGRWGNMNLYWSVDSFQTNIYDVVTI